MMYPGFAINERSNFARFAIAMKFPLKGILVGNGATSWDYDSLPSTPQTAYGMGLIT